jgi:hypothetical protein
MALAWRARAYCFDATIVKVYGGYSSAAERLTVAQDVVGSIPTSRPNLRIPKALGSRTSSFREPSISPK